MGGGGRGGWALIFLKFTDKNILDCLVQYGNLTFFLSCIYGEPDHDGRDVVWERLSRIGVNRKEPWFLIGDFNEILNNGEKTGGTRRAEASFQPFVETLRSCDMVELTSKGDNLTWGGKRWNKWIQCALDRSFGSKVWHHTFPSSNQTFLDKRGSYHRPVWMNFFASPQAFKGQFRFDKKFLMQPNVKKKVGIAWASNRNGRSSSVSQRIRSCRNALSRWKEQSVLNA